MSTSLFPPQYSPDFEQCWKLYRSRANMPSCMRKDEAYTAWAKTRNVRPELAVMLRCINLYLDSIEGTKRILQNGRDVKTIYCYKLHFATFLNKMAWRDYMEQAMIDDAIIPAQIETRRPTFRASDYPDVPENQRPKRSAAEILASRVK